MSRSDLDLLIDRAALNPMAVQKGGIAYLEKVRNGEVEIVDASNAFVYLGEFAATLFVNAVRKNEISQQKQYPELAQSRSDLYHHMSTTDYIGTFATPAVASFAFSFHVAELIEKSIPTGEVGVRKLVIGRNTQIVVGGVTFTMQYPVEILILPHGGIQVVYDNSKISPLQSLETNNVENSIENYNTTHEEYLQIVVPMQQMMLKSYTAPLMASKVFDKAYSYEDLYYYCRVYTSLEDGTWREIKTTHSDQVFDAQTPTALLKVLDGNKLNVSIPQIYYTTGQLTRELRVDIFTTRGVIDLALETYTAGQFVPTWRDLDNDDNRKYSAPIATIVNGFIVGLTSAEGGTNELSFEKLKERVINNALGPIDLPITDVQIQVQLDRLTEVGFSCTTALDNLTKRLFLATRELPAPKIDEVSTGVGSNVVMLMKNTNDILSMADAVDNGARVTLLPSTLYKNEGGFLSIVDKQQRAAILALPGDQRVEKVTYGNYLYTPFHYVYDYGDSVFTVRPYYFGEPKIARRFFVDANRTLGVGISSSSHDLRRTDNGWALRVMTNSTTTLKEVDTEAVVAQLAFTPVGDANRCYLDGTLIGRDPTSKEWIFEFQFDSTWDVDGDHSVFLDGFVADGISPHSYASALSGVFDVFYGVEKRVVFEGEPSQIDQDMGLFMYTQEMVALYHEQVTLTLGYELEGLWARARPTIGEETYLRYDEDVVSRHTANVPEYNPDRSMKMEKNAKGKWTVVYQYRAGDVELNEDGTPVVLHAKGTVVLQNGLPIVTEPRKITRQVELCLFDGVYYFATGQGDTAYKATVPMQIVQWVNTTLAPVRKKVIEQTLLQFHPKATIGQVKALVDGSEVVNLEAAQSFSVVYYVSTKVYDDLALQAAIRRATRRSITAELKPRQVTRDRIEAALKAVGGEDIITLDFMGLGGSANYRVVTMMDDSGRLTIGKKLVSLPNNTFSVEDNIDIRFELHSMPK